MPQSQRSKKIQEKITNHLIINGEKYTSEKILLKSVKELQKDSKKQAKKILKLAVITLNPTFKFHTLTQKKRKKKKKKEIPAFINKAKIRVSLAIKSILFIAKKKRTDNIYLIFKKELLSTAQGKSETIDFKINNQKQILTKKHLLRYYRWN